MPDEDGEVDLTEFKEASLKDLTLEELKELDFDLNKIEGMNLAESTESIILFLLNTDTSPRFEMALFECLKHCTYDNISITPHLFDDLPQARGDYYELVKETKKK